MANLNVPDQSVQIVTTAEPGYDAIRVPIPMSTIQPGSAIAAGTTFDAAAVPLKFRAAEGWGSYVAGRRVTEPPNLVWQHFVRALPTTPTVAEAEFHPVFGRTFEHTYDDLITNSRPDRGDAFSVSTGALSGWDGSASTGALTAWTGSAGSAISLLNVRVVLDCTETDQGQGLCEVKVRTVENAEALIEDDKGVDEETGELIPEEATHTLTSTRPEGSAADAEGYVTLVTKAEHNWYVSTRSKAVTGPINLANALTWTKTERTPVYWPPVLLSYELLAILDEGSAYWHKRFNYSVMAAYTGDVKVHYSQWWQKTRPNEVTATEMLPTAISIRREWNETISIEPCLHSAITLTEDAYAGRYPWGGVPPTGFLQTINYSVPATNVTAWPDTVTKMESDPYKGGYKCLKRVIDKPVSTVQGITISLTPWRSGGYVFSGY